MKTAEGGRKETSMALAVGTDVATVPGQVLDKNVAECLTAAQQTGRMLFVDLLGCGLSGFSVDSSK